MAIMHDIMHVALEKTVKSILYNLQLHHSIHVISILYPQQGICNQYEKLNGFSYSISNEDPCHFHSKDFEENFQGCVRNGKTTSFPGWTAKLFSMHGSCFIVGLRFSCMPNKREYCWGTRIVKPDIIFFMNFQEPPEPVSSSTSPQITQKSSSKAFKWSVALRRKRGIVRRMLQSLFD